ncbi:MAG: N-acetyltransferase family protein [Beijerinckiaceae bacterium]
MVNTLVTVRTARPADAAEIANVHDLSWREAYRGIIPGRELERMISRRGPKWWQSAVKRGSNILVLDFDETVVGYATYGRNRARGVPYKGEIYELYLTPEFQGLGFGRRLFRAARADLTRHRCDSVVVWALEDNARAVDFYRHLGGAAIKRAPEKFGNEARDRIAFGFE